MTTSSDVSPAAEEPRIFNFGFGLSLLCVAVLLILLGKPAPSCIHGNNRPCNIDHGDLFGKRIDHAQDKGFTVLE